MVRQRRVVNVHATVAAAAAAAVVCLCSLLASISAAVILVTQGTPEPRRANAPRAAGILC